MHQNVGALHATDQDFFEDSLPYSLLGNNSNVRNEKGFTVLMLATGEGHTAIIEALLVQRHVHFVLLL